MAHTHQSPVIVASANGIGSNGNVRQLQDELARANRERSRLLREVELAQAVARIVRDEQDTLRLAQELARHAAHALNAERAVVFLVDGDEAFARALIEHGSLFDPGKLEPLVYGLRDGVTGQVALRQQIVTCNDAQEDERFALHRRRGLACRNALCVPVIDHQRNTIAVIEVHNQREGRLFSQDDARAARTLAMTAATGIARARMFERMCEWAQSLESLLAFNAAINAHLDPQSLIRRLVEDAARFLKADGGMAGLAVPQENGETVMIAESYWHLGEWHPYACKWRANEGLPGFMLVSEFPYVTNAYRDDALRDPELIRRFDIRQALCVPIKNAQDQVLGFFKLHNIATPERAGNNPTHQKVRARYASSGAVDVWR
jgi:GAF domain-containing protein